MPPRQFAVAGEALPTGQKWIQGELAWLGYAIAASTVWEILHAVGIDPVLRRAGLTWRQFLTARAHAVIACDFLVVETVLLQRLYVLAFIEPGRRRLHVAVVTAHPPGRRQCGKPATSPWTWGSASAHCVPDP